MNNYNRISFLRGIFSLFCLEVLTLNIKISKVVVVLLCALIILNWDLFILLPLLLILLLFLQVVSGAVVEVVIYHWRLRWLSWLKLLLVVHCLKEWNIEALRPVVWEMVITCMIRLILCLEPLEVMLMHLRLGSSVHVGLTEPCKRWHNRSPRKLRVNLTKKCVSFLAEMVDHLRLLAIINRSLKWREVLKIIKLRHLCKLVEVHILIKDRTRAAHWFRWKLCR